MKIISKLLLLSCMLFTSFRGFTDINTFINQNKIQIKKLISKLYDKLDDIDRIELKITNPKKVDYNSIFNRKKYTLKIYIITDENYLIKTIEENNYDKLANKTEEFIVKYLCFNHSVNQ